MKLTIERDTLFNALNIVKDAVPKQSTIPSLKDIYLSAKEGNLFLRGTDGKVDINYSFVCEIEEEGDVCVNPLLVDILSNYQSGEINLSTTDKKLTIKQGKTKNSVSISPVENYPEMREVTEYREVSLPLLDILKTVYGSVSNTPGRKIYQSFYFNPHEKFILGSSGNQISLFDGIEYEGHISFPNAHILNPLLKNFTSVSDSDVFEIAIGDMFGMRLFQYNDDKELVSKLEISVASIAGEYSDISYKKPRELLGRDDCVKATLQTEEIKRILKTASIYSEKGYARGTKDDNLVISVKDNHVTFSMDLKNIGDMKDSLEAETDGEIEVSIDPKLFKKTLDGISSEQIELRLFDNNEPFLMLNDNENFVYLQVQMYRKGKEDGTNNNESNAD